MLKQKVVQQNVERKMFSRVCNLAMQFKSTSTDTAKMTHTRETEKSEPETKITCPSKLTEEFSFRNEPEQCIPAPNKEVTVQNPECSTLSAKTCKASSKESEVELSLSKLKETQSQTTHC